MKSIPARKDGKAVKARLIPRQLLFELNRRLLSLSAELAPP